jgi:hypothetical protein
VHGESYERIDEAVAAERRIKGWSRAKKEAYIRGDFETLTALSHRRSKSDPLNGKQSSLPAGASFETRCSASLLTMKSLPWLDALFEVFESY